MGAKQAEFSEGDSDGLREAALAIDDPVSSETTRVVGRVGLSGDFFKAETPENHDPFAQSAEEIKKMGGLSSSIKRKIAYGLTKADGSPSINDGSDGNGIIGRKGAKSKQLPEIFFSGYNVFDVATPPFNLSYLAQLYEISPFNYAAINAKAANVVGLGYTWTESPTMSAKLDAMPAGSITDKARKRVEASKLLMDTWLDSLNQEALFQETMTRVYTDYQATGNGYLEIGRTAAGDIGYLGHIPATSMRVRIKRDGYVQIIGNRVVFFNNYGTTNQIKDPIGNDPQPNEVIHFKNYTPTNSYYGVPDVISAKQSVAGNEFASRFNLEYFENKAVPRHVVVIKGATLGAMQERRLMEFFEVGLKGKSHRTLVVPLPADSPTAKSDFEIKPVEARIQDGSFNEYRIANRDEILMAHRVPITKIGIPTGLQLAAAAGADKIFKEEVVGPDQAIFQKKVNFVIKEKTDILTLEFNQMTLTSEDVQSQIDDRRIMNQTEVPNEQRARRGLPGLPDGDKIVNLHPVLPSTKTSQTKNTTARAKKRTAAAPDRKATGRNPKGAGRSAP